MLNGTNMLRKDNPRWGISNAIETIRVPGAHLCTPFGSIGAVYGVIVAWLIGIPRRAGRRLFEMKDEEARWHRWQVTETLDGLSRQYRDPRFDALKADESLRRHGIPESKIGPDGTGCPLNGERLWRPAVLGAQTTRALSPAWRLPSGKSGAPHPILVGCVNAWVQTRRGLLPIILYTAWTDACLATKVRVIPSIRYAHLVILEVIRNPSEERAVPTPNGWPIPRHVETGVLDDPEEPARTALWEEPTVRSG